MNFKKLITLSAFSVCSLLGQAQSWTVEGFPISVSFLPVCGADISMPNDNTVWVIGSSLFGGGFEAIPSIAVTSNGGNWWSANYIPLEQGHTPSSVCAINASTAWITSYNMADENLGRVYKTTDGGATWTHQTTAIFAEAARYVHFFNMNDGVAVGDSSIYITSNGGMNWTYNGNLPVPFGGATNFVFNSNEAKGDTVWLGDAYGYFYRTTDKGHSWTLQAGNVNATVKGLAFKDSQFGMAITATWSGGQNGGGGYTDGGTVQRTTDGGATWTAVPYGLVSPNLDVMSAKYDIAYVPGSPNTFIITSEIAGFSCITYNGGDTWQFIDSNQKHTALAFTDIEHGWSGGYWTSMDEGMYKWDNTIVANVASIDYKQAHIFPNPATNELNIELSCVQCEAEVKVYDALGRTVLSTSIRGSGNLNIIDIPSGTYHVVATTQSGKINRTFVKR